MRESGYKERPVDLLNSKNINIIKNVIKTNIPAIIQFNDGKKSHIDLKLAKTIMRYYDTKDPIKQREVRDYVTENAVMFNKFKHFVTTIQF
jgi:hypothetical protein